VELRALNVPREPQKGLSVKLTRYQVAVVRGVTPVAGVMVLNFALFTASGARQVAAMALASAIPAPADRGAYMSIAASMQQLAGGVAASLAGLLVTQTASGYLEHYERLGYVVSAAVATTIVLMRRIDVMVMRDALAREA
jgi:MFS family permease